MAFLFHTLYRLFWFHLLPPFIYTLRILLLFPIHKSKAKPLVISRKTDRCWSVSGLNKSKNRIRLVPTGDQEEHHDQCSHSISCRLLRHHFLHRPEVRSEGGLGLYSLVTALDTPWSATRSARSGAPGPQPHRESCRSSCSRRPDLVIFHLTDRRDRDPARRVGQIPTRTLEDRVRRTNWPTTWLWPLYMTVMESVRYPPPLKARYLTYLKSRYCAWTY